MCLTIAIKRRKFIAYCVNVYILLSRTLVFEARIPSV